MLWVDASLADDLRDSKSACGAYLAIVGPNSFAPIMSFAKKQTAVSHSSIESEIIALEEAVRTEGLPILTFWETVVAILYSRPAIAPATSAATHHFPKQSFYSLLPSPVLSIHNRDNVRRPVCGGGVFLLRWTQSLFDCWRADVNYAF